MAAARPSKARPSKVRRIRALTSRWFAATAALTAGLLAVGVMVPTTATAAEDSAVLQLSKVVNGTQTDFQPGDTFSYEIQVGCSSTIDSICAGLVLEDALPDPLVFDPSVANPVVASLSPTGPVDIQVDHPDDPTRAIVTIGADQAASVIIDNHFGAILPVTGAALAGIGLGGVAAVLALVGGIVLLINRRQQA